MRYALLLILGLAVATPAHAQVPANIESELMKIGQIVDPACTAKLYRPLMPQPDFNTYWPPDAGAVKSAAPLYPGVTILRDQAFGPNSKDVLDIFVGEKGGDKRPVLIYVAGGTGNKIEQQVRESNAFYDNIARWATKNGMVGVLVQRHPGAGSWDDGGRDLSLAVDWIHDNIEKQKGDPSHMVIWAHSAGNGPLGVYVGHPERWKNGVQVKGAIFMSGNPVPGVGGAPGGGAGGQRGGGPGGGPGGAAAAQPGVACGLTGASMTSNSGKISGPSGFETPAPGPGRGGPGGPGRGGPQLTPEQQAERDNLPGFKKTSAKIVLAYAELDPGIMSAQLPAATISLHDAMCTVGKDHCPEMWMLKGESHMSEVFSVDTADKTVSEPVLKFVKKAK